MFDPKVDDMGESLIVSRSLWIRVVSAPICLFFFCGTVCALIAPVCFIAGGNTLEVWGMSIAVAALTFIPTRLFWHGSEPLELQIWFNEGRYEMRGGFRHFPRSTRGTFTDMDHLTIWNRQVNRCDVSYTTALIWRNGRRPFEMRVSYNNRQEAVDWANDVAQKLNIPLQERLNFP